MKTTLNVAKELADLKRLTVRALAERYAETFGETTIARNKAWFVKRIIRRLQVNAEGSLSERAKHSAAELADDAGLHSRRRNRESGSHRCSTRWLSPNGSRREACRLLAW